MAKSIKLKDNNYIDSTGIVHNRELLSNVLDNLSDILEYSTDEVKIGTWIDGKPIYRKVIKVIPTNKKAEYNPNLTNLETLINVSGIVKRRQGYFNLMPCNYTNWEIVFYDFSSTHYVVGFSDNQWNAGVEYFIAIFNYTKTTD
jgi:hypothetical protein